MQLDATGTKRWDLAYGGNNADALYALLNREINTFAGQGKKSREKWTLDQLQAAYDSLDEIGDQVADTIKTAIED